MKSNNSPIIIGRAEKIDLPAFELKGIPAKVDTGADLSSIWATRVKEKNGKLSFKLFGPSSKFYTDEKIVLSRKEYTITRVANSFGHRELRYQVKLGLRVHNKRINGTFTLANRARKTYPVLLGRRLLHNKFVVDVSRGEPLKEIERAKKRKLRKELRKT